LSERAPLLAVQDLLVRYGEVPALTGVALEVHEGEAVALIGPNGAGKTTLMNTLSGLLRPAGGSIRLDGDEIAGAAPAAIVRRGISQVPEGRRVFGNLDVEENLLIGAHTAGDADVVHARLERIYTLFPRLRERRRQVSVTMSGGEQQMLAIGRGLMSGPRLLLLDEPSLGLAPKVVTEVFRALRQVVDDGTTLLLVEQNSRLALRFASRAYVLETGRVALEGRTEDLEQDERVRRLYLGQGVADAAPADPGDGAELAASRKETRG
jgi:branched-chain amino acid transport system ATP-binding protein